MKFFPLWFSTVSQNCTKKKRAVNEEFQCSYWSFTVSWVSLLKKDNIGKTKEAGRYLGHLSTALALESVGFGENSVNKFGQNLVGWETVVLYSLCGNVTVCWTFLWILWLLCFHHSSKYFYPAFLVYQKNTGKTNLIHRCTEELKWINTSNLELTLYPERFSMLFLYPLQYGYQLYYNRPMD